jgi:hypothetical protein
MEQLCKGNGYLSREQFYALPWELRRRWNEETRLDRLPPSLDLLREVAAALKLEARV